MGGVGLTTNDLGARSYSFGQCQKPIPFERQDQIGQNVTGQQCGQRTGRVSRLSISDQSPAAGHYAAHKVTARIRFRNQAPLHNG